MAVGGASSRNLDGHRPRSAGDVTRHDLFSGGPRLRDSSLESGIVGIPPPFLRENGSFTAAEVEQILTARDKELLTVKRKFHRVSRKNEALETTVSALEGEVSKLRATAEQEIVEIDGLRARVTEVELSANRKAASLRSANQRSRKTAGEAEAETAKARSRLRQVEEALCKKAAGSASFARRAVDAEAKVVELEEMLGDAQRRVAEANEMAAAELAARVSEQEQGRAMLEKAKSARAEETRTLKAALEEAFDGLQEKREAERETNKVVAGLQAWRERITRGEIVELPSAEARRLRWSEEQGELTKEANASLRLQLAETGRLLAEAEHSFDTVKRGFGDAAGTISGLSDRLSAKEKELVEADNGLRATKAEAGRLKKCVASFQLSLSEARRTVRGRERALDMTKKGIEALVRARQSEIDAREKESGKRVAAEAAAVTATADKQALRRRVESAEACIQEMDTERRVLLQYLAAARQDVSSMRAGARLASASPDTGMAGGGEKKGERACWRETTRGLLERAVSDWSAKTLLRRRRRVAGGKQPRPAAAAAAVAASSTDGLKSAGEESFSIESGLGLGLEEEEEEEEKEGEDKEDTEVVLRVPPPRKSSPAGGFPGGLDGMVDGGAGRRVSSIDEADTPRLEVVRSYTPPQGRGGGRDVGWCWDLSFARGNGSGDDFMARFGLETLGKSLRELGVGEEGTKMVLAAVVRMFDTVLLVRNLAAKQCAEVRAELAAAVARLSSRAAVVLEARGMARKASACNSTLLIRLVNLELRCWSALETEKGQEASPCMPPWLTSAKEKAVDKKSSAATEQEGADEGGALPSNSPGTSPVEEVRGESPTTSATSTINRNQEGDGDRGDSRTERVSRLRRRLGEVKKTRRRRRRHSPPLTTAAAAAVGVTLDLSNLGLTDEALNLVVQVLLRRCTHPPKAKPADWNAPHNGTKTAGSTPSPPKSPEDASLSGRQRGEGVTDGNAILLPADDGHRRRVVVPLSRLILRGNCVTDAGAVALAPLVQASHSLVEVDLRGNSIGKKGKLALKKALASNPWVHSVTSEDACSGEGNNRGSMKRGVVLRARRRPRTTSGDRAKAYAFAIIPPSLRHGRGTSTTTTATATTAGKLAERFTDSRPKLRPSSDGKVETSWNAEDDRAPAHGESTNGLGRASRETFGRLQGNDMRLMSEAVTDRWGENITGIATSCKIDLRGCCSRQPFPFGAVTEDSVSHSRAGSLQVTPSVGRGEHLTPGGRRRRQRRADVSRSRRRRSNPELEGVQHSPSGRHWATDTLTSIGSVTATRLQQQQQRRVQRRVRDDCRHPAKSERQDADDLKSLLSASRLIFDEIEGHCEDVTPEVTENGTLPDNYDGVNLSRKNVETVRTQNHRAPVRGTINLSAEGEISSREVRARWHDSHGRGNVPHRRLTDEPDSHIAGTAHWGENNHQPGLSQHQQQGSTMLVCVNDGDQNSRPRLEDRSTVHHPDGLPALGVAASDACHPGAGARARSKPVAVRANGSNHRLVDTAFPIDKRGAGGSRQQTLQPSVTDVGDTRIAAVAATRSTANTPAFVQAGITMHSHVPEVSVAVLPGEPGHDEGHADSHSGNSPVIDSPVETGKNFGYLALNRSPDQQATYPSKPSYDEGGSGGGVEGGPRHASDESNDPPRVEALAEGVQTGYLPENYSSNGWVYDETSGSWMFHTNDAPAPSEAHDTGDADDGWRYDKHRAAWYYEEPATDGAQPFNRPEQHQEVQQQYVTSKPITGGSRGRTVSTFARVAGNSRSTAAAATGKWGGGARRQGSRKKPKKNRFGAASRALLLRKRMEGLDSTREFQGASDDGDDEAGGIVAGRIKELQHALEAKS